MSENNVCDRLIYDETFDIEILKGTQMGRFCVLYLRMKHFQAHLMVRLRVVHSKVLRIKQFSLSISSEQQTNKQNGKTANVMLKILDGFSFV